MNNFVTLIKGEMMTHLKRVSVLSLVLAVFFVFVAAQSAMAVGTASEISISNTATISFSVGGEPQDSPPSATSVFSVDNKVDLTVTPLTPTRNVVPGSDDNFLVFYVSNEGNTAQSYLLSPEYIAAENVIGMHTFRIYIESQPFSYDPDGTNITDPTTFENDGSDILYDPSQPANYTHTILTPQRTGDYTGLEMMKVYIVANTPDAPTANGDTATINLLATTMKSDGTPILSTDINASLNNHDDPTRIDVVYADGAGAGTYAADTAYNGQHSASGTYIITSAILSVIKGSEVISDPFSSPNPKAIPGATVRYTIEVENTGAVAAENIAVTDMIPANTTFVAGSISHSNNTTAASPTYSIEYSDDGGTSWVTDSTTLTSPVTHIRVTNSVIDASVGTAQVMFQVIIN